MKLAIFSKKRTTKPDEKGNTRPFWTYLTTLVNKTSGEPLTVQVKFREACGAPEPDLCPCFIEVPQGKCNLSWGTYTNDEGEELECATMWISEWGKREDYVDHSMDEFEAFGV